MSSILFTSLSLNFSCILTSLSVSLSFYLSCTRASFSMYFSKLLTSLPFHPLHEPVCQFAFSSSSRTCLSVCLFILFTNLSAVSLPFHPLPEPVCQFAKINSSIAFMRKRKMLCEINDFLILMQKSGFLLIRNESCEVK